MEKIFSKEEIYNSFIAREVYYNQDNVDEVLMAIDKLKYMENGQDALMWLIRFLVRTHPDPISVFEHVAEIMEAYNKEWDIISTIFEIELAIKYVDMIKN
ncbi:MAG: hypothetical protein J1F68_04560 [Clostridiales bacterium]|nr:hypothetical protein [Clostridiales bacterium]